jgi:predicted Zn finger-like uncharacterized protein
MKIVCDSCATKYSISDDKVRGKVFKIRCKKCSHIIVVRGTNDAAAAPAAVSGVEAGGWHLVVDGEQVGPLPEAEIRARLARGEINAETYIWKEGLADWLKLATVAEFSDAVAGPEAGEASGAVTGGASDLFTDSVAMGARDVQIPVQMDDGLIQAAVPAPSRAGGLFGAVDAAAANGGAARTARASAVEVNDVFSAPSPSRGGGGGDLFASHAAAQPVVSDDGRRGAAAGHYGGRVDNLTAQRHENSVLFSLANLQSLAMPSAAAAAKAAPLASNGNSNQSEGSGLIDIRAMAATTLGSPSDARGRGGGGLLADDLPTFGSFSAAAPVLLPIPSQNGLPKWLYAVFACMLLLLVGIGVMAYKLFTTKPVVVEQAPAPVAPPSAPIAAAPAAKVTAPPSTAPAPSAIPDDSLPPREGTDPAKAAVDPNAKHDKALLKKTGKGAGKEKKGGAGAEVGSGKTGVAVPAPAPEPEAKKPAKGSLDDLLEGALSGKKTRARPTSDDDSPAPSRKSAASAAAEASAAGPLAKGAVVSGMIAIKPKINDCYNQFKVPGMAMVNVVIAKSGKVSSATVSGKFVGTPTGTCVEKAVKSASFPPSEGLTTPYPFQLK